VQLYVLNPTESVVFDNLSIDSVALKTQIFENNKPVYIDVFLKNHHPRSAKNSTVYLYNSDERIAMDQVNVAAGQTHQLELVFTPKSSGKYFLNIEIEEDDLTEDNVYYFNLEIPEELKILFVGRDNNLFLANAMETLRANSILNITQSTYNTWQGFYFNNFDVIILEDPPLLNQGALSRVYNFLDENRNIIVVPGPLLRPEQLNRMFRPKTGTNMISGTLISADADNFYSFAPLDIRSNLFLTLFTSAENKFDSPKIFKYFKLNSAGQCLLELKNRDAYLSKFPVSSRGSSIFMVNSAFMPEWGNMVFKGFYMPFLYRMIYIAARTESENGERLYVGDKQIFPLSNQSVNREFKMEIPGGNHLNILPSQTPTGPAIVYSEFNQPGHYKLYRESKLQFNASVNMNPEELRGPFIELQNITSDIHYLNLESELDKEILQSRNGSELWLPLVILAILLLFMELFFIKKIEGRSESNPVVESKT